MANEDLDDFLIDINEKGLTGLVDEESKESELDKGKNAEILPEFTKDSETDLPEIPLETPLVAEQPVLSGPNDPKYNISIFKYSLNEPLKSHIFAADSMINFINSAQLNFDQQKVLEISKKELFGSLETIIHLHDKYFFALSDKNLQKEAEKEYFSYFEGVTNNNKIQFLKTKQIYQMLQSFNIQVEKYWDIIHKLVQDMEAYPEMRKFARELLDQKVNAMLLLCDQTNELLVRLKMILGTFKEEIDNYSYQVTIHPTYQDGSNYSIKQAFQGQIADKRFAQLVVGKTEESSAVALQQDAKDTPSDVYHRKKKESQIDKSKLGSIKNFSLDRVEQSIKHQDQAKKSGSDSRGFLEDLIQLEQIGRKSWNQSKFYQLSFSKKRVHEINERLKQAVFFTDSPGVTDEAKIRKKVIIGIARKNRLTISKDVRDFLLKQVEINADEISQNFAIPLESRTLFLFHFGAGQMAEMLKKYLMNTKVGFCYIAEMQNSETRISKEFYPELVDESVMKFWQNRIHPANDDSFHNFWDFSRIADIIRNKYQHELEVQRRKLDAIFDKMKETKIFRLQKEQYFQNHFSDWFGFKNIFVFKRFIDRSVFMNWNGGSSRSAQANFKSRKD